jgi:hypothetical protein
MDFINQHSLWPVGMGASNHVTVDERRAPPIFLAIEEASNLGLGEETTVCLHPLVPDYWPRIGRGMTLGIHEGSKLVGTANVVKVVISADQA